MNLSNCPVCGQRGMPWLWDMLTGRTYCQADWDAVAIPRARVEAEAARVRLQSPDPVCDTKSPHD